MKERNQGPGNIDVSYPPSGKTQSTSKRTFWIVTLSVPFLFLLGSEIVLRAINYGGTLDLVIKKSVLGKEYYTLNREVARRYFSQKGIGIPEAGDDIFEIDKRPTTKRIFMLGESTMAGYPFDYNATASRLLQDRLRQLLPQYTIEVVNVGLAAVNSYTVLDFMKELVDYQPDAFIVYLGHNEFYGAMGIGSTEYFGQWRWLVNLYLGMRNVQLFLAVRDVIGWMRNLFKPDVTPRQATLMEVMVREKAIPFDSREYEVAKENFEANLHDIVAIAKNHRVPMVLSTLVSNIRDQAPLLPTFSETTTAEDRYAWENLVDHGEAALQISNFADAQRRLEEAIRIDSTNALAHFFLANCFDSLRRYDKAKLEYEKARDYDGLRFRASTEFNRLISTVCQKEDIAVADAEMDFEAQSPNGIVGNNLMLEHLHPNFEGYFLLAKIFLQTLADYNLPVDRQEWHWERNLTDSAFKELSGVTEFDLEVAKFRIFQLTSGWPFKQASEPKTAYVPENKAQELAVRYARKNLTWSQARYDLADWYTKHGSYEKALREYFAVSKVIPYYYYPLMMMGDMYRLMDKSELAEKTYKKASALQQSPFIHVRLGMLYFEQGKTSDAIEEFEVTLLQEAKGNEKMDARAHSTARYFLGVAYGKKGDFERAKSKLRLALQIDPRNDEAKKMLDQIH